MLNSSNVKNGQEQYESFTGFGRRESVQYDYRHTDGELFSCVKPTLEACKQARDLWLSKRAANEGNK